MTNLNTNELDNNRYKNVLNSSSNSTSNSENMPIVINFALPLTVDMLKNYKLLDKIFVEAVIAVKKQLNSNEITIFKSTVLRNKGNLKCITVIIPAKLENSATSLIYDGIAIRERQIRPYSVKHSNPNNSAYPKRIPISFRNIAHFLNDDDIFQNCGLQSFTFGSKIIHQQRRLSDGSLFFTGEARTTVLIKNEDEECLL